MGLTNQITLRTVRGFIKLSFFEQILAIRFHNHFHLRVVVVGRVVAENIEGLAVQFVFFHQLHALVEVIRASLAQVSQGPVISAQCHVNVVALVVDFLALELGQERDVFFRIFLGLLRDGHDQVKVVHAEGNVVQLVHVHQEDQILQSLFRRQSV